MKAFERIVSFPLKGRILDKPRDEGITMVIDTGLGLNAIKDLVEVAGDYIDIIKLAFGTSRLISENIIKKKVKMYHEYEIDVMPGGTFLEIAFAQGKLIDYLIEAKRLGFTAIEVSDGTITISNEDRSKIIKEAYNQGFKVIAEVGKKMKEEDLTAEEIAEGIKRDIELGVFKVIIESREAGKGIGFYDETGEIIEQKLDAAIKGIDIKNILFEAPHKNQQVYFIKRFGPNVNLGNIQPNEVIPLEALRQGLRADTLKLVYK
ncbi:MAG: phosphosulfolactate synthase [Candidatus Methanomethylicaceae archaeon]